jgi:hypothetical protein
MATHNPRSSLGGIAQATRSLPLVAGFGSSLFLRQQARTTACNRPPERHGCMARNGYRVGCTIASWVPGPARHLPRSVCRQSDDRGIDLKFTRHRFGQHLGSAFGCLSGDQICKRSESFQPGGRHLQICAAGLHPGDHPRRKLWNREPRPYWLYSGRETGTTLVDLVAWRHSWRHSCNSVFSAMVAANGNA